MKIEAIIQKAKATRKQPWQPQPFPPEWEAAFTYEQLERLAIMTEGGQMTDTEALNAEGLQ